MDRKIAALKSFYRTMQSDKVKLELMEHGFAFLDRLKEDGFELEYGELAANLVHKYRLLAVSPLGLEHLLEGHLQKKHNVCLYFNEAANTTFCLNLDNNCRVDNLELIAELRPAVAALRRHFRDVGVEPLVIQSGRGYHLWCRVAEPVENKVLYEFLLRIVAQAMATMHDDGIDYRRVKFNLYPDPQTVNVASLRLFGSEHMKKKSFSYVCLDDEMLSEEQSWEYFFAYAQKELISVEAFARAHAALLERIPRDEEEKELRAKQ